MLIIFEGADNSGKTTIAIELGHVLNYKYFKHTDQQKDITSKYRHKQIIEAKFFLDLMSQTKFNIIVDRHILSEYVYSKVYDRHLHLDLIFKIDQQLASLNTILIYCEKRFDENYSDNIIPQIHLPKIIAAYREYLKITKMKYLFLDTTDENLTKQILTIITFLKEVS